MNGQNWKEMFDSTWKREGFTFIQFLLDAGLDINFLNKYDTTMLGYAAECGNLEVVEFLVQKGADCNVMNSEGSKPIHIAAQYARKEVVKFFLDIGISVDCYDKEKCTPLHYVAESKSEVSLVSKDCYEDLVHFLLDRNADLNAVNRYGCTPLLIAAQESCTRLSCLHMVKLFIKLGANLNYCDEEQTTVLHFACEEGWPEIVQTLVGGRFDINLNSKNSNGFEPVIAAAESWNADIVKLLVGSEANIECRGALDRTLLHYACEGGWLEVVRALVHKGCDLNAKDFSGNTPLISAAAFSRYFVVEYLIKCGANVKCSNRSESTVLHYACEGIQYAWLGIVECLIKKGSDVNKQNNFHNTPLHISALSRNLKIVKLLLSAGADCNVENIRGETAFYNYIKSSLCLEGITLFLGNGAYFRIDDYAAISEKSLLKESILSNTQLCTLALINKFNNADLRKLYEIPMVSKKLPPIEKLKITSSSNVAQDIEDSVKFEIQTKGYCNVLNVSPIVLSRLCVLSFVEYYNS